MKAGVFCFQVRALWDLHVEGVSLLFFFYGNSFGIVPEPRNILKKEKLSITKEELQLNWYE